MIRLTCPHCGKGISAPESAAGKRAKCPGCQGLMSIPADATDNKGYSDIEVLEEGPARPRTSPVTTTPRRSVEDIPTVEPAEDERPRRRRSSAYDDDDDYDDYAVDDRPRRRRRRREYTKDSGTPRGQGSYAICYNC